MSDADSRVTCDGFYQYRSELVEDLFRLARVSADLHFDKQVPLFHFSFTDFGGYQKAKFFDGNTHLFYRNQKVFPVHSVHSFFLVFAI